MSSPAAWASSSYSAASSSCSGWYISGQADCAISSMDKVNRRRRSPGPRVNGSVTVTQAGRRRRRSKSTRQRASRTVLIPVTVAVPVTGNHWQAYLQVQQVGAASESGPSHGPGHWKALRCQSRWACQMQCQLE